MLYQNIPTEILTIFAAKFLRSGRYEKFSVEHTLLMKMCLYTRKVKQRLIFLTKVSKTTAAKHTEDQQNKDYSLAKLIKS